MVFNNAKQLAELETTMEKTTAPKTASTKTEQTKPERKKLSPADHVAYTAEALLRLQTRLRVAERGLYGDHRGKMAELRRDVLNLFVKVDGVRADLETAVKPEGK